MAPSRLSLLFVLAALLAFCAACEIEYHPEDWEEPSSHGLAAKLQSDDCQTCHGDDLSGGSSQVSCDSCHSSTWRDDCTFCHGGIDDRSGAPPRDLNGDGDRFNLVSVIHRAHPPAGKVAEVACDECHKVPDHIFSPGHTVDPTPGVSEVVFRGINSLGTYQTGACSELYCHGNGRKNGSVRLEVGLELDCNGCHAYDGQGGRSISELSGKHSRHLRKDGIGCETCHSGVVGNRGNILDTGAHINGGADVKMAAGLGLRVENDLCSGTCHDHNHEDDDWFGPGDSPHPPEWFEDDKIHGLAAKLGQDSCNTNDCHGSDLRGGDSGVSCDSCHTEGWRTDCNFCHEDSGTIGINSAFRDHRAHVVEGSTHSPFECDTCHTEPRDVLSPGHMFDSTPGRAEVVFSGLARGATWSNGSCGNLYCHGDGRRDGSVRSGETMACDSCHGSQSNRRSWGRLSGEHDEHLGEGVDCGDCHGNVATPRSIVAPSKHVNGRVENRLPSGVTQNGDRCSGQCHGEGHNNESW